MHPVGGVARVVVATPPEMGDTGEGGNALRSLVLPSLFEAQPDGTWAPSLVESGSDGAAKDGLSAWFTLRPAAWTNGTGISFADLERTMDSRLVSALDPPDANGRIVVHFKHALPGWRSLWSDIAAPKPNVFGGPFVVQSVASALRQPWRATTFGLRQLSLSRSSSTTYLTQQWRNA